MIDIHCGSRMIYWGIWGIYFMFLIGILYKRTLGTHIQRIRDPKQRQQGNDDVLMLRNLVAMEVPSIEVM